MRLFADFTFPETIPLLGWNLVKAEALSPLTEMQIASQVVDQDNSEEALTPEAILAIHQGQEGTDIFMNGRRYYYEHPEKSESLTATFRYIVNVDPGSNLVTYYQRQAPQSEIVKTLAKANKTSQIKEKNILSFIHQDSLYYSACLTSDRQTQTESYNQITRGYNTPQLLASKFKNLIPWLMGQQLLQDDRCLWMELKISPLSAASASELKPLWQDFLNYWTKHYPHP